MRRAAAALMLVVAAGLTAGAAAPQAAPLPSAPACPLFPAGNVWNQDVAALPVATGSDTLIATIGLDTGLHPDFGSYRGFGIPYNTVPGSQRKLTVRFDYSSQSDRVGYPIPRRPRIEVGSDHHLLVVDSGTCKLYEMWNVRHTRRGWRAGSGAVWKMTSNALRPDGWTSADAAGLPILPGLVRYPELATGVIDHALRFTAPQTRDAHIYPARHDAGSGSSASLPAMGLRVRLKASFDLSQLSPQARVVAVALQHYGMILADNGSPWYVSGVSNTRFSDDDLRTLNRITGRDLEVVDTSGLVNTP
ncbi:MAG TPA: hypothetical protein VM684_01855 [Gaiellales bacterium]|jgi:hypothetical protein|nr:hypothetical protein [Gaiellales bacterium]